MASFVLIGKTPDELSEMFLPRFRGALREMRFRDEDAVINIVKNYEVDFLDFGIVATGFIGMEYPPEEEFFGRIQRATGMIVSPVPSLCKTAGFAKVDAPYLEIFTIPSRINSIVKKLKEAKIFWDLEFHFPGSNHLKCREFCIKVNILEREVGVAGNIIFYLKEVGFKKDQIQVNIIPEFVSGKRMKK
ncbi:MAG: hypothetical protein V3574_05745 [Candidatus Moraniibacteriota bacterium]